MPERERRPVGLGRRGDDGGNVSSAPIIPHRRLSVLTAASELDSAWFAAHPREGCYLRIHVPGEFGGFVDESGYTHVLVIQLFPGARHRSALRCYSDSDRPITMLVHAPTGDRWRIAPDGAVTPIAPTTCEPWEVVCCADTRRLIEVGRAVRDA